MKLHELFAKPGSWTQGAIARDYTGRQVPANYAHAVCWCLMGGMNKCYPSDVDWKEVRNRLGISGHLAAWNDHPNRTHAEVLDLCIKLDI